jgi:hypothetical protein
MEHFMNTPPVPTSKTRIFLIFLSAAPPIVFIYQVIESKILFYSFTQDASIFVYEWVILFYLFAPFIFYINNSINYPRLRFITRLYKQFLYIATALIAVILAGAYFLG